MGSIVVDIFCPFIILQQFLLILEFVDLKKVSLLFGFVSTKYICLFMFDPLFHVFLISGFFFKYVAVNFYVCVYQGS